jgi:hypothetical protein
MLLWSPLWLFAVPGSVLLLAGLVGMVWLLPAPRRLGGVELDVHTLLVAAFLCLIGYQILIFGAFTKQLAVAEGLHPPLRIFERLSRLPLLEAGVLVGLALTLAGIASVAWSVYEWRAVAFGNLDPRLSMRRVIPAVLLLMLGVQTIFTSFFLSVLGLRQAPGRS